MASQQPPGRPWFRLASMNHPTAPTPAPTTLAQAQAQPPARQPRPPFVRPTFRPPVADQPQQNTQPRAPAPPPTPPVAAASPATASPPPPQPPSPVAAPRPATASPPPQPPSPVAAPPTATTSAPSSPSIIHSTPPSSLPPSPVPKPSPKSTVPPVATSSSVPLSPNQIILSAASTSLPTSPAPKVMSSPAPPSYISATATATFNARAATPTSSPKIISPLAKTSSTLSPKMEPVSTPPSPLVLPPAQIKFDGKLKTKIPAKAEQKTISVQETIEQPRMIPNSSTGDFEKHVNVVHNGKSEVKINIETKDHKGFHKKYLDYEDFGKRVITIAGENRGAIMELSPCLRNKGNPTALDNNGEKLERESNEEGRSKMKDETHKMVRPLKTTFINSNMQGASSSILLDCSFTQHGPGVHLSLSGKANGGRGAQLKD